MAGVPASEQLQCVVTAAAAAGRLCTDGVDVVLNERPLVRVSTEVLRHNSRTGVIWGDWGVCGPPNDCEV